MKIYKQKIQAVPGAFVYEYWWATHPHIYGHRLIKVRIPPSVGACQDWPLSYTELEGREDEPIDKTDFDSWSWVLYISEPENE